MSGIVATAIARVGTVVLLVGALLGGWGASPAVAATPDAPSDLSATVTSSGLSVALNWSPVPGADQYRVYRLSGPFSDIEDADVLGVTDNTSYLDQSDVRDGDWWYAVTAISGADESAQSNVVEAQTPGELDEMYNSSINWLADQQQSAEGFRITFDDDYPSDYDGRLSGQVDEPTALSGARLAYPYVSFVSDYGSDYSGPVDGTWEHLDDPSAYEVQVYSTTDSDYLQGTFDLNSDGTWSSGDTVVHPGVKSARLVRISDGTVVAVSGGPDTVVGDVVVDVYSRTDVDYLQEQVPLGADGRWSTTKSTAPGEKIARVVDTTTGRVLNSTEWSDNQAYTGLERSFAIPQDDPDYGYDGSDGTHQAGYRMEQRSFIYDDALSVLAFLSDDRTGDARAILSQLSALQNPDGSLPFSVDVYLGQVADEYKRAGAIAWVGYAAVQYQFDTGSDEFLPLAEGIARYLEGLQVTEANGYPDNDPRYGSVLAGEGQYDADYNYTDIPLTYSSTEHNIDAYFFFRDLGYLTDDDEYSAAADLIKQSLLTKFWDSADQRFYQGVSLAGPDTGEALDLWLF